MVMLLVCGIWAEYLQVWPPIQIIKRMGHRDCRLTGNFIHSETAALIRKKYTRLTVGHTSEGTPGLQLILGLSFDLV